MRRLTPMLAILLIFAAGSATAEIPSAAGAEADCTFIQGRWICAWGEPDAAEGQAPRDAVNGTI
jgi:hypothetical protein